MGAGGSIPADEAAAKEAGRTDDEIALYKFCVGLQDGSTKDVSAEGCEFGPPGATRTRQNARKLITRINGTSIAKRFKK